jgi:hypothetical protein
MTVPTVIGLRHRSASIVGRHEPRPMRSAAGVGRLIQYRGRADYEASIRIDERLHVGRQFAEQHAAWLVMVGQRAGLLGRHGWPSWRVARPVRPVTRRCLGLAAASQPTNSLAI